MDLSLLVFCALMDARARRYSRYMSAFWREDVCWWMEAGVFPGPHLPGKALRPQGMECWAGYKDALSGLLMSVMARLDPGGGRLV